MQLATAVARSTIIEIVVKEPFFQMELGIRATLPCFSRRFIQKMNRGTKTTLTTRKDSGRACLMLETLADSML